MSVLMSATPILLLGVGVFYLFRLRGFCFLHPVRCLRALFAHKPAEGISPFRALTVALAGTLGVGNIVGVASALYLGGPGAVLWMMLSALVAMLLINCFALRLSSIALMLIAGTVSLTLFLATNKTGRRAAEK